MTRLAGGATPAGEQEPPGRLRPPLDDLLLAERAARMAGESAARWWQTLAAADAAVTDEAMASLIDQLLPTMARALDADEMSILLANEQEDELVARAAYGLPEVLTIQLAIRKGEGMAGRVLANRAPALIPDMSQTEIANPVLRESGLRSLVAVPILAGEHALGVLHAGSYELDRFTEADVQLLEALADRLGTALERVRRFEAERAARRRAEEVAEELGRLQRVTAALGASTSTVQAVAVLAEEITSAGDGQRPQEASVWLLDDGRLVRGPGSRSLSGPEQPTELELSSPSPLALAYREHRSIAASSLEEIRASWPGFEDLTAPSRSFVLLPILLGGRCLGVFAVGYADDHECSPQELELLEAIVHQGAQALARVRLQEEQANLLRINAFLARTARVMAEAEVRGFRDVLDRVAVSALAELGDICLVDLLGEEGRLQRVLARHRDPDRQRLVARLPAPRQDSPPGWEHPAVEVMRTRRSRWSDAMDENFLRRTTRSEEHFRLTSELGFRSYLTVPLLAGEEVIGALTFVSCERPLGPEDVRFAESLADQVALVVRNARRYEEAFRTSELLQQALLPRQLPEVPGVTVESRYLAATWGLDIGGDFYDLYTLPSGAVGFAIGDVTGHDRHAAGLMGQLRSAARALSGQVAGPGALVAALRESWELLGFDRMATALLGELDPGTGRLCLASAGHYPPLLLVKPGQGRFLPVKPGTPLGAPPLVAREWQGNLGQDQLLLLYTDGAVDERRLGSDAGRQALARLAVEGPFDPAALCDRVIAGLAADRRDDVALLALRRS